MSEIYINITIDTETNSSTVKMNFNELSVEELSFENGCCQSKEETDATGTHINDDLNADMMEYSVLELQNSFDSKKKNSISKGIVDYFKSKFGTEEIYTEKSTNKTNSAEGSSFYQFEQSPGTYNLITYTQNGEVEISEVAKEETSKLSESIVSNNYAITDVLGYQDINLSNADYHINGPLSFNDALPKGNIKCDEDINYVFNGLENSDHDKTRLRELNNNIGANKNDMKETLLETIVKEKKSEENLSKNVKNDKPIGETVLEMAINEKVVEKKKAEVTIREDTSIRNKLYNSKFYVNVVKQKRSLSRHATVIYNITELDMEDLQHPYIAFVFVTLSSKIKRMYKSLSKSSWKKSFVDFDFISKYYRHVVNMSPNRSLGYEKYLEKNTTDQNTENNVKKVKMSIIEDISLVQECKCDIIVVAEGHCEKNTASPWDTIREYVTKKSVQEVELGSF